jgi:16S rRNA (cytosine1402-N4)-methyltransferase
MDAAQHYHTSVLLQESINALAIQPNGVYVDVTFGGGGHSKEILKHLGANGKLFVFDQDVAAKANLPANEPRITFIHENFSGLQRWLKFYNVTEVNGILADLGVSSHQFDVGERGFSIRFDGPLDMRMDTRQPITAHEVLSTYNAQALQTLFQNYGEVTNAKTLAHAIVQLQSNGVPNTIYAFKAAISTLVKGNPQRYFAQVFQALRIEVNKEMQVIEALITQAAQVMAVGGRLAIISFHSVEDRLVKQFLKNGPATQNEHPLISVPKTWPLQAVHKKPIEPSETELKNNSRSRSAKLRVAEKIILKN